MLACDACAYAPSTYLCTHLADQVVIRDIMNVSPAALSGKKGCVDAGECLEANICCLREHEMLFTQLDVTQGHGPTALGKARRLTVCRTKINHQLRRWVPVEWIPLVLLMYMGSYLTVHQLKASPHAPLVITAR